MKKTNCKVQAKQQHLHEGAAPSKETSSKPKKRVKRPTELPELLLWTLAHCRSFPAPEGKGLSTPCLRWCKQNGDPVKTRKQVRFRGHWVVAARIVYSVFHGCSISSRTVVRHRCDVRSCCEIDHLELGTQQDNARDAVSRQRRACEENAGFRKHPELIPRGENEVIRSEKAAQQIEALLKTKNTNHS